jgi:hypothetical protein
LLKEGQKAGNAEQIISSVKLKTCSIFIEFLQDSFEPQHSLREVASPNFHSQLSFRLRGEVDFFLFEKRHYRPNIRSRRKRNNEILGVSIEADHFEPFEKQPDFCGYN